MSLTRAQAAALKTLSFGVIGYHFAPRGRGGVYSALVRLGFAAKAFRPTMYIITPAGVAALQDHEKVRGP